MATVCPVHDPKSAGELGLSKPVECFSLHCSDTVGWTTLQEGHSAIGGGRFGMGGQNHRGSGDGSPPAGSRGGAPVGGLGDKVPQKLKNF